VIIIRFGKAGKKLLGGSNFFSPLPAFWLATALVVAKRYFSKIKAFLHSS